MEERTESKRDLRFWFERVKWEELPAGHFDGTLFEDRIPLPIQLPRLDTYCAPYLSGYGEEARAVTSLAELVGSEELTAGMGMHPENPAVHDRVINQISFVSLVQNGEGQFQKCPLRQCYERGWWCVPFSVYAIVPHVQENRTEHTHRAEALLALLGKPSRILVAESNKAAFCGALHNGVGKLCYYLEYEREDYVLTFRITDAVVPQFGLATLAVTNCMYYAKPLWDYDRVEKRVILEL